MKFFVLCLFCSSIFADGITGNWGGARKKLADEGIRINSTYTADIGSNVSGGLRKKIIYAGFWDLGFSFDLEKLLEIKGLSFVNSHFWLSGQNLSNSIGNAICVQEAYAPGNYFFGECKLVWSTPDEKATIEGGRIFAGDVFATSELWQYYLSCGVNGNLEALEGNIFFPPLTLRLGALELLISLKSTGIFLALFIVQIQKWKMLTSTGCIFL